MMLARRSQSHPRSHFSRSISASALRSRWRTSLPLLTVGCLLLASVVFLQLKLASIRHASRRPVFENEDDGAEVQLQQWDKIAVDDDGDGNGDESMATPQGGLVLDHFGDAKASVKPKTGQGWALGRDFDPSQKLELDGREFLEEGVDLDSAENLKENMDYFEDDDMNFGDGGLQDLQDLQDDQDEAFAEEEEDDNVKNQMEGKLAHFKGRVQAGTDLDEERNQKEKDERSIPDAAKTGKIIDWMRQREVMLAENKFLKNKSKESNKMDIEQKQSRPVKKLERLGQIKNVSRRIPSDGSKEHLKDEGRKRDIVMDIGQGSGIVSKGHGIKQSSWGNLLGLKHLPSTKDNSLSSILIARKNRFNKQPSGKAKSAQGLQEAEVMQLPAEPRSYKVRTTKATKSTLEHSEAVQGIFGSEDRLLDAGTQAKFKEAIDIKAAVFQDEDTARKFTATSHSTKASRDLPMVDRMIFRSPSDSSLKDVSSPDLQGIHNNGPFIKDVEYSDRYPHGVLSTIINSTTNDRVAKISPGRSSVKMLANRTFTKHVLDLKKGLISQQGDIPSEKSDVRQKIRKVLNSDHFQGTNDSEDKELEVGSARKLHDSSNLRDLSLQLQQSNDRLIDVLRTVDDAVGHEIDKKRSKSSPVNMFQQEFTNSGIETNSQGHEQQETYLKISNKQDPLEIHVENQNEGNMSGKIVPEEVSTKENTRQWGSFPGLDKNLSFSKFMDVFLDGKSCQMKVFMAWTTPAWSFSVRHQRGLESVFHFHPKACVVVFSESIELDFFKGLLEKGFRIAVVFPNLEELLQGTPTEVFSSIWFSWRKVDLFYIHYTELLRLAALYKYGGVYMDFDVILLRNISPLRNTVGQEYFGKTLRLNGAIMAFERGSPFLEACLVEFTATYDDQLLSWNGADLLTRVADSLASKDGKKWNEVPQELNIVQPKVLFPIMSSSIHSYFRVPAQHAERQSHMQHYNRILQESFSFHLWNSLTATLVPETGSLVEKILNRFCIMCSDIM